MNTDNVLMHGTDREGEGRGVIRRKTEKWILQTRLFLDSEWGKLWRGLLSGDEEWEKREVVGDARQEGFSLS